VAREALLGAGPRPPRHWCNCSAGYEAQRFNAIFGAECEVELLESVMAGDARCRFAITIPGKALGEKPCA
jgi:hypothetical protein